MSAATAETGELAGRGERRVRLGLWLATVYTAVFVAAGWLVGATWYWMRHSAASARYGFMTGARRYGQAPPPE